MLHKVIPAEKGIPHAKDIYVENVTVTNAASAFNATGYKEAPLENFVFTNCTITAISLGILEFTKDWKFNNVSISVAQKPAATPEEISKEEKERMKN